MILRQTFDQSIDLGTHTGWPQTPEAEQDLNQLGLLGLDESEHLVETSVEVVFELRTPADLARALDKGAITLTIEAVRE